MEHSLSAGSLRQYGVPDVCVGCGRLAAMKARGVTRYKCKDQAEPFSPFTEPGKVCQAQPKKKRR